MNAVVYHSKLTCPGCGYSEILIMPADACLWFHECGARCREKFAAAPHPYLDAAARRAGGEGRRGKSALEILEQRYAQGEIDRDEYLSKRQDLES